MATETAAVAAPADAHEIKLFNKWSCDVHIDDISLQVRLPLLSQRGHRS